MLYVKEDDFVYKEAIEKAAVPSFAASEAYDMLNGHLILCVAFMIPVLRRW